MNYVYRFLDANNEVVYVGKTNRGMKSRMRQHFGKGGHLSDDELSKVKVIEYIKIKSQLETNVTEMYLINLWKPEFNKLLKYKEVSDFKPVDEKALLWRRFDLDELFLKLGYELPTKESYAQLLEENELLRDMLDVCYKGRMFEYRKFYSEYEYAENVLKDGIFLNPEEINGDKLISLLELLARHQKGETSRLRTVEGELIEFDFTVHTAFHS